MVAGAKYRGEFEERLKAVLSDIAASQGQVVTFIDEMHTVVGAGAAEGSTGAGDMLKPMLARGELRMIGATTLDEYRRHVEKDAALERRFQPVMVGEPSVEDTVAILRGLKDRYQAHHKVDITDAALVAAATLSDRYITSRFLPDKAIDLVDEAASRLRMEIDSKPVEIDELQRAVDRLRMEELALADQTDEASRERLATLRQTIADTDEELTALNARWEREKGGLDRVGEINSRLDDLRGQAERAQRDGDLGTASRLLYAEIPALERELVEARATAEEAAGEQMVAEEVGADDVRAGRRRLDRHPRRPAAGGRDREAAASGGGAAPPGGGPGRGRARGVRRRAPRPAPASPTPTARWAPSSSWGPRASGRRSSRRRSRTSCSTTSGRWSGWT